MQSWTSKNSHKQEFFDVNIFKLCNSGDKNSQENI